MATSRPSRDWYWIADEIEAAECRPLLTHAAKAKLVMGHVDKTDKLDARGLATLLHNGTLPSVWLPPAAVRDERELPRTRMAMVRIRTNLKNRVHATLAKFGLSPAASDLFSQKGRTCLEESFRRLPPETRRSLELELELLAVSAVARHLAEATYSILRKEEPYREPPRPR